MKKYISYLLLLVIAGIYVVSTMGYGIHECTHDGTKDVVVLFGETPCEYVHSHIDENGHIYTHSHAAGAHGVDCDCASCADIASCSCGGDHSDGSYLHNGNCCTTTVFALSHDQVNSQNTLAEVLPAVFDISIISHDSGLSEMQSDCPATAFYPDSFRLKCHCSRYVMISQFRI